MPLLPGAEPFSHDGTTGIGVVVSHGFTGMPESMRPWAQYLADAGYSVRLPLLPGHGTAWQDANKTTWHDWYGAIRAAYEDLASSNSQVFACGLSMGGTLVTKLAEDLGDAISGLVLVNVAYGTRRFDAKFAKYISWAVKSMPPIASDIKKPGVTEPGYDRLPVKAAVSLQQLWADVVPNLGKVTAPIRYYHSAEDHVVDTLSGELLHKGAVNTTLEEIALPNSYHVATMDNDADTIFAGSVQFIREHSRTATEQA